MSAFLVQTVMVAWREKIRTHSGLSESHVGCWAFPRDCGDILATSLREGNYSVNFWNLHLMVLVWSQSWDSLSVQHTYTCITTDVDVKALSFLCTVHSSHCLYLVRGWEWCWRHRTPPSEPWFDLRVMWDQQSFNVVLRQRRYSPLLGPQWGCWCRPAILLLFVKIWSEEELGEGNSLTLDKTIAVVVPSAPQHYY